MIPVRRISTEPHNEPCSIEPIVPQIDPEFALLTSREYEIARMVAMGFANKEVGRMLEISHWTVAAHLKATFLKLGVKRRSELAYMMRKVV